MTKREQTILALQQFVDEQAVALDALDRIGGVV